MSDPEKSDPETEGVPWFETKQPLYRFTEKLTEKRSITDAPSKTSRSRWLWLIFYSLVQVGLLWYVYARM